MTPRILALIDALVATETAFDRLEPGDLERPTCCAGWSVRDVLDHAIAVTAKFAAFAAGETDAPRTPTSPPGSFAATAQAARRAWAGVDVTRTCRLPFGTFTAEQAAGINLFDLLAHHGDIADAVGRPVTGTAAMWEAALAAAREVVGDEDRDPAQYAPPRRVPASAPPSEKLRAHLGR